MPVKYPPVKPPDWPASTQKPWAVPLMRLLMLLVSRYQTVGVENLPARPPFLMVANHMSYFDIPAMNIAVPYGVVGLAAKKYKGTLMEPLFRIFAVLWVEQFSADREALRKGIFVLEHDGVLAIAPEGTRSHDAVLHKGTDGAAYIATRTNAQIVPSVVWGTEKVLKYPRPKVYARIGKPFRLPEGRAKGDQLSAYTERIMCAMAALLPEQYHGYYAGNPLIDEMAAIVC